MGFVTVNGLLPLALLAWEVALVVDHHVNYEVTMRHSFSETLEGK